MAVKLAFSGLKGGITKTTSSMVIADQLRRLGRKVLLIDMDPQRSATGVYGCKTEDAATLADMLYSGTDAFDCIQHQPIGDIIPSDEALASADVEIKPDVDRFYHLSDTSKKIDEYYDYIICDCPPGDGVLLGNALSFVNYVVMPITADKFGIQGLAEFPAVLNGYKKRINPSVSILGVVIAKYKGRQSLTKDLENNLIPSIVSGMGTSLFRTKIRESVKCQEAQAVGQSLYDYAPSCTTAKDYADLTNEILERIKSDEK